MNSLKGFPVKFVTINYMSSIKKLRNNINGVILSSSPGVVGIDGEDKVDDDGIDDDSASMIISTLGSSLAKNLDLSKLYRGGSSSSNERSQKADPFVLDDVPENYVLFAITDNVYLRGILFTNHYGKMENGF